VGIPLAGLNSNKTEYICIGREMKNLETENEVIKKCESFKYLGSVISTEGASDKAIDTVIAMVEQATTALHGLIWNHNITQEPKKRIFHSTVENIVLYGAEIWSQTKTIFNKIRTVELDYMRRCLQLAK
jgi:hypothetical protein